jgi:hypothetical protein
VDEKMAFRMDLTRISLAGMALSAWTVCWIARTIRAFARKK